MTLNVVSENKIIGEVGVDSGNIELGDCGRVQVRVPTGGDGLFVVQLMTREDGSRCIIIELDE